MKLQKQYMKSLRHSFLIPVLTVVGTLSAWGQTHPTDTTLSRTVIVEHEYNPEIMDARKINVVPKVEEITLSPNQVEYDGKMIPATTLPIASLSAFIGEEKLATAKQGYARAGYGNNGNLDAKFNYLFLLSPKDKLNLSLGIDGMDGKVDLPETTWKQHFYKGAAGLDYSHQFNKMALNVGGNFGMSCFNYYWKPDKQNFTTGDFRVGVQSTDDNSPFRFNAETGVLLFSRKHNWERYTDVNRKFNESIIRTKASATGKIAEEQEITIAFEMNNRFYSGKGLKDFTTLLANPYYEWGNEDAKIHLGANVDLAKGFGKNFYVSPDIKATYLFSDSYVLYAKATGGRLMNDFRGLEHLNPYGQIFEQVQDGYEQINASAGLKASPASGLWFTFYGGYQNIKDDLYIETTQYNYVLSNTNNFYAGAQLNYEYKNLFGVSVAGKYNKWDTKQNKDVLNMKPELEFDLQLKTSPVSGLLLSAGYQHVQRTKNNATKSRQNAISNLSANVSYEFIKGISVYAKADNLLNKEYSYYWAYPNQGINFLGGLSFRF